MNGKNTTEEYKKIKMLITEDIVINDIYKEYLQNSFEILSKPRMDLRDLLIEFLKNPNTDYSMVPKAIEDTFVSYGKNGDKLKIPLSWEILEIENLVKIGIEHNNIAGLRELKKINAALYSGKSENTTLNQKNDSKNEGYSLNDLKVLSIFLNEAGKERFANASLSKIFKDKEQDMAQKMISLNRFTNTIINNNYDGDFDIIENSVLRAMFKNWKDYKEELIHIKDSFDEEYGSGAFLIYSNVNQIVQVNNYVKYKSGYLNNSGWNTNDFIKEFKELLDLGFVNGGSIVFVANYPLSYLDVQRKSFLNDFLEEPEQKNSLYKNFLDESNVGILESANAMISKNNPYQRNNIIEIATPVITALSQKIEKRETLTEQDMHTLGVISYECFNTQTNLAHLLPLIFSEVNGMTLIEGISSDEQIAKYIWVTLDDMINTFENSVKNNRPLIFVEVQDIIKSLTEIIIFTKNDPEFSEQYKQNVLTVDNKINNFVNDKLDISLREKVEPELKVLSAHLDEFLMKIDVPVAAKGNVRKM